MPGGDWGGVVIGRGGGLMEWGPNQVQPSVSSHPPFPISWIGSSRAVSHIPIPFLAETLLSFPHFGERGEPIFFKIRHSRSVGRSGGSSLCYTFGMRNMYRMSVRWFIRENFSPFFSPALLLVSFPYSSLPPLEKGRKVKINRHMRGYKSRPSRCNNLIVPLSLGIVHHLVHTSK